MSPKRDYYYDNPADRDGPNYRDVRGWLIGIGIFIVIMLALYGAGTIIAQLLS